MGYNIRPLSPDLAETFSNYLTNLDFSNTPHWASCFCRYYQTTCSFEEWRGRSLETNRNEALQEIKNGNMRGYLAFDGEACVGWCNANDIANFPRIYPDMEPFCRGKSVGCTICFLIHPLHRGKGLARELLARAIADYHAAGFDAMLALPVETADAGQRRYRGTLHMYQQAGYREIKVEDNLHIMWLDLK